MSVMIRVSEQTRAQVLRVAEEDFGGVTADEAVQRLLEIHWQSKCVKAVLDYREHDENGWAEYLSEANEWDSAQPAVMDPWDEGKSA